MRVRATVCARFNVLEHTDMTIRILAAAVFLLAAIPANSAPPPRMDIDKLAILLDLDEYQQQQVESILTAQREAAEAHRDEVRASAERPDFEAMQAYREQMHDETLANLGSVLTPTQLEKFKVLMEMAPQHGPRHHGHPDKDVTQD